MRPRCTLQRCLSIPSPCHPLARGELLPARPDLAVIDLYMPEGSGEALATALCRRQPGLPLIFLSAFGHHPDAVLPGLLFEKPVRLGALCRTIAHMLFLTAGAALMP